MLISITTTTIEMNNQARSKKNKRLNAVCGLSLCKFVVMMMGFKVFLYFQIIKYNARMCAATTRNSILMNDDIDLRELEEM